MVSFARAYENIELEIGKGKDQISVKCPYSPPVKSLEINCRIFDNDQHEAT